MCLLNTKSSAVVWVLINFVPGVGAALLLSRGDVGPAMVGQIKREGDHGRRVARRSPEGHQVGEGGERMVKSGAMR
jgi:hypothetical protein